MLRKLAAPLNQTIPSIIIYPSFFISSDVLWVAGYTCRYAMSSLRLQREITNPETLADQWSFIESSWHDPRKDTWPDGKKKLKDFHRNYAACQHDDDDDDDDEDEDDDDDDDDEDEDDDDDDDEDEDDDGCNHDKVIKFVYCYIHMMWFINKVWQFIFMTNTHSHFPACKKKATREVLKLIPVKRFCKFVKRMIAKHFVTCVYNQWFVIEKTT